MLIENFDKLNNFKSTELDANGKRLCDSQDIGKIKNGIMFLVDDWVSYVKGGSFESRKAKCTIHCITSGDHLAGSAHYTGDAVDCHISSLSLFEMVLTAMMFPFSGIGFYPHQNNPFVHVDLKNRLTGILAMWYRNEDGVYVYDIPLVLKKLKEL